VKTEGDRVRVPVAFLGVHWRFGVLVRGIVGAEGDAPLFSAVISSLIKFFFFHFDLES